MAALGVTPGQSRKSRRHLETAPLDRPSAEVEGVSLPRPTVRTGTVLWAVESESL
jgi:hypothetical protein